MGAPGAERESGERSEKTRTTWSYRLVGRTSRRVLGGSADGVKTDIPALAGVAHG